MGHDGGVHVVRRGAYPSINFGGREVTEYLLTPSGEKRVQAILSDAPLYARPSAPRLTPQ